MDHAYTMSGSSIIQTNSAEVYEEGDIDHDLDDVHDNDPDIVYDANQDDSMDDCPEDRTNHTFENVGDEVPEDYPIQTFSVLLPTEEWMQMLPPQYLLHYIRERTVFRDSGKATREGRESTAPLKRGWLQGAWRETLKEAIAKQTGIPCVINFNSSNFLKQPFSRKVGPPLWRVRACCRQDDGLCLKFNLRVQDFHPSKPQVEIVVEALGTLLEGQAGEERHTITASDHMKAIKSLQRFNASSSQHNANGFANPDMSIDDPMLEADDGEVQRLKLSVPTADWISFLPAEAAEAYVLERSNVAKDRLALEGQEAWAKGLRHFVPRVTKDCRQYLKRALAERTGLPCRIGLTGRCHLKPPFSRKKRAPLFVTNGFCGRKDLKCLRFRFTVQDFDPQAAAVTVDVEIRGRLLTGPEGDDRHSRRPSEDPLAIPPRGTKRAASAGDAANRGKRQRRNSKKGSATDTDVETPYAVGALQTEAWPEEFDLNAAEVILDEGRATADDAVNTIQVMSDVNGAESALGEDAARELVQLANEALSLATGGSAVDGSGQLTATKIVQNGDQVFIFVSDPNEPQDGQGATIEAVEVNCDELAAEHGVVRAAEKESEEIVQTMDGNGSLAEFLIPNPEPQPEPDAPCMEYRWQLQLPMTDWLKLLPAKSLRYYIHERTVGREVWVEEGWERQFRSQTLQNGWRDLVRRAALEQTDIPCQVCFRGRSSLKLPFSRKHAAALWRTQGYCARGDRNCLIYKFCVQDFHPDDEAVTVEVYAVGKLHRDCRRWFRGEGTLVDTDSMTRGWPQGEVEGDGEAEDQDVEDQSPRRLLQIKQEPPEGAGDGWDDNHMMDDAELDRDDDEEERVTTTQAATKQGMGPTQPASTPGSRAAANEAGRETTVATGDAAEVAGEEMYQAVLKSLVTFKTSLHAARRCPLKMQAALRLLRNADSMAAAPCKTPDCLCRPPQPLRSSCRPRLRWPDRPRPQAEVEQAEQADQPDTEIAAPPPLQPSPGRQSQPRSLVASSPPPLRLCGTPRPAASTAPTSETPSLARSPVKTTPGSPIKTPDSMWQKVTRAGPVVLTAIKQQPSIIRLSPAQIAANARRGGAGSPPTAAAATAQPAVVSPRSSSKLVSLSSAIVRSAVLTPSIIKPSAVAVPPDDTMPRRGRPPLAPTSQPVVSSSQDVDPLANDDEDGARDQGADQGADPSWIVDEMRSVILGGEQQGAALKQKTAKTAVEPDQKPAEKTAVTPVLKTPVVKTTVNPMVTPVVKTMVKPMVNPMVKPAVTTTVKPVVTTTVKPVVTTTVKPAVTLAAKPAANSVVKPVAKPVERIVEKPVAKPAPKAPEKKMAMTMAKPASTTGTIGEAASPVSPPRNTRVMVKKVGHSVTADDLPLVERALRSLERSQDSAPTEEAVAVARPVQQKPSTRTVYAPSRPVTRGVTKMVSASSSDPPPLVPIRKGPTANKPQAAATPSGRVSRVSAPSSSKAVESPAPAAAPAPQTSKVTTRTDESKLVSSVKALFPKGKVLILKPSAAPILRSSPRRP